MKHKAEHWACEDGKIRCGLCPHSCLLQDGAYGVCGVRLNDNGILNSMIYGDVSSLALDPVEKKPLFHFHPGSSILSAGTVGCSMKCPYCQNWQISQDTKHSVDYISPEDLVSAAVKKKSIGIAYTYSEPIIWFEYVRDCAVLAKESGLVNVMVTNGYIQDKPLAELLPLIDAWNIDLKCFDEDTYRRVQKGSLADVCRTIQTVSGKSHCEVTTLVVTGMNDGMDEMERLTDWLSSVDPKIPWHISRYFPAYSYDKPPTDVAFMIDVFQMAKKKLRYIYCGNISGHADTQQTYCLSCGNLLISRSGYKVSLQGLDGCRCAACGEKTDIII
ncbi:MAG: AmmeMemoRadiSam system radical SAM enzyme [Spirochaetota bacterium]